MLSDLLEPFALLSIAVGAGLLGGIGWGLIVGGVLGVVYSWGLDGAEVHPIAAMRAWLARRRVRES